tara:strand:+ start:37 stop:198 length:162 start_codon:yes stop_codon:yes gene_type:complete
MENDKKNKKVCCYLGGACDLICFVFGSYLFSLALIGKTCTQLHAVHVVDVWLV